MRVSHREAGRLAAQARIGFYAEALFQERGYEATTVDMIADAAGVSRRTFFRYFAAKDDVLFVNSELDMDALLQTVRATPGGLAPWDTLESALSGEIHREDQLGAEGRVRLFALLAAESPALHARYLARLDRFQTELQEILWERWSALHGDSDERVIRLVLSALSGAFFALLDEVILRSPGGSIASNADAVAAAFRHMRPHDPRLAEAR